MTAKHETLYCERCNTSFECKANSSTYCQCTQIDLTIDEAEYIGEYFENCLCISCLKELKNKYVSDID